MKNENKTLSTQEELNDALGKAVKEANIELTKLYLSQGADPNATLIASYPLLFWVALEVDHSRFCEIDSTIRYIEIASLLLVHNAHTIYNNRSVLAKVFHNHTFLIQLIKRGVEFDLYGITTPLEISSTSYRWERNLILVGAYINKFYQFLSPDLKSAAYTQLTQCKYKPNLNWQHVVDIVSNSKEFAAFDQERLKLITETPRFSKRSYMVRKAISYALDFMFPNAIERAIPSCNNIFDAISLIKNDLYRVSKLGLVCKSFSYSQIPVLSAGDDLVLPPEINLKIFNYYVDTTCIVDMLQVSNFTQKYRGLGWGKRDIKAQQILDKIFNAHQNTLELS